MYIERLSYKNVGPIENLDYQFRKNRDGNPIPLVIVGRNGGGKSILLSNIVDAFYEIADEGYDNATQEQRNGHQYYKIIASDQISFGQKYMVTHIQFEHECKKIEYMFKSGDMAFNEYKKNSPIEVSEALDWKDRGNYKNVTASGKDATSIFESSIICFFGPNRYMPPAWMGKQYFATDEIDTYSMLSRYSKQLNNPITVENIAMRTQQWLFDVITDSRADLERNDQGYRVAYPPLNHINLLSIARQNVERIMSEILGEEVIFRMGNRSQGANRFSIHKKSDGTKLISSLEALSTGQLALFNMFATIIRYGDTEDIDLSHQLNDIKGIVVIDEIELHLHTQLQRDTLPRLIAMFPKVQFIITSHSPLFLLGMQERFGDSGLDIIEMPTGRQVSAEQFSEFESAYRYFTKTERYHKEINDAIDSKKERTLIITEGPTDWKHMKAAYSALCCDQRCAEWLPILEFDFLEYEPKNSTKTGCEKLEMSASHLKTLCEQHSLLKQARKMIFIADADVNDIKKALEGKDNHYKSWGNNVFSIVLPLPKHRESTPEICIEHYYSDNEIKTEIEINGIKRRLFMGNEFDTDGLSNDRKMFCNERNSCGEKKIRIIDGHEKSPRVYKLDDADKTNIALSKMRFAEAVMNKEEGFGSFDFSSFIPLFEIIRDILTNESLV